jgi:hypothetical protein
MEYNIKWDLLSSANYASNGCNQDFRKSSNIKTVVLPKLPTKYVQSYENGHTQSENGHTKLWKWTYKTMKMYNKNYENGQTKQWKWTE